MKTYFFRFLVLFIFGFINIVNGQGQITATHQPRPNYFNFYPESSGIGVEAYKHNQDNVWVWVVDLEKGAGLDLGQVGTIKPETINNNSPEFKSISLEDHYYNFKNKKGTDAKAIFNGSFFECFEGINDPRKYETCNIIGEEYTRINSPLKNNGVQISTGIFSYSSKDINSRLFQALRVYDGYATIGSLNSSNSESFRNELSNSSYPNMVVGYFMNYGEGGYRTEEETTLIGLAEPVDNVSGQYSKLIILVTDITIDRAVTVDILYSFGVDIDMTNCEFDKNLCEEDPDLVCCPSGANVIQLDGGPSSQAFGQLGLNTEGNFISSSRKIPHAIGIYSGIENIVTSCGDGNCDTDESFSTCPEDCDEYIVCPPDELSTNGLPEMLFPLEGSESDYWAYAPAGQEPFGYNWSFGSCGGANKRHNGADYFINGDAIDIVGKGVYAIYDGIFKEEYNAGSAWGKGIVLEHSYNGITFTSTYIHIIPVGGFAEGETILKGTKLGTVKQLSPSTNSHLHFGVRRAGFESPITKRGALPQVDDDSSDDKCECNDDPLFPERFIDPTDLNFLGLCSLNNLSSNQSNARNNPPTLSSQAICGSDGTFKVEVTTSGLENGTNYTLNTNGQTRTNINSGQTYTFYSFTSESSVTVKLYESTNPNCSISETVTANCLVGIPLFTVPSGSGQLFSGTSIPFQWNKPTNPNANTYRIQVYKSGTIGNQHVNDDTGFYPAGTNISTADATSTIVVNKKINTTSNSPSWTWDTGEIGDEVYEAPQAGASYTVIIRAANSTLASEGWSSVRWFSIAAGCSEPITLLNDPPIATTYDIGDEYTLHWSSTGSGVCAADVYELQLSTSSTFASGSTATLERFNESFTDIISGSGTVYWRVRAKNGIGWGDYSVSRNFIIGGGHGSASCPLPPNTNEIILSDTYVKLDWDDANGVDNYSIRWRKVGTSSWTNEIKSFTNYHLTVTPGEQYEWQVKSNCGSESSDYTSLRTISTTASQDPDWDLRNDDLSISAATRGSNISASIIVENEGGTAPANSVDIFLDDDTNPNNGVAHYFGSYTVNALNPNGTQFIEAILNIPNNIALDSWYVVWQVDPTNQEAELNENNNTASELLRIISSTNCNPPTGFYHDPQSYDFVKIYWNNASDAADYEAQVLKNGAIVQDGTLSSSSTRTNITNLEPCTEYEFRMRTNCYGGNRSSWSSYFFTTEARYGSPDLIINNESASKNQVQAGENITINYNAENPVGDYCDEFKVHFFFDTNDNYQDGTLGNFGPQTITEKMGFGHPITSVSKSINYTIPLVNPGDYTILICADINNDIDERDDNPSDNCEVINIRVYDPNNLPNLKLQNTTINGESSSVSAYTGQQIELSYDVLNNGTLAVTDNFSTILWIDNNSNPNDGTLHEVNSRYNSNDLNPNQSLNRSIGVNLPTLNAGNYKAIICTDRSDNDFYNNRVVESNENDNCKVIDLIISSGCNDPYEPNNNNGQESIIPVSFSGNTFTFETSGACFGTGEADYDDWYRINAASLPETYDYSISFIPKDKSTSNGYTAEVEYELRQSGLPENAEFTTTQTFTVVGGDDVEFKVEPEGNDHENIGTYAFRLEITRTASSDCIDAYEPNNDIFFPDEASNITMNFSGNTFVYETDGACSFETESDPTDCYKIADFPTGYDYSITVTPFDSDNASYSGKIEYHVRNITGSVNLPYIYSNSNTAPLTHNIQGGFDEPLYFIVDPENKLSSNAGTYKLKIDVTRTAWVSTGADYIVEIPYVPTTTFPTGTPVVVGGTVKNIGNGNGTVWTKIRYYLNEVSYKDGTEIELEDDNILNLNAGESMVGSTILTGNDLITASPGNYYVIICADDNNSIIEDNENNNCVSVPVTITSQPSPLTIVSPNGGEEFIYMGPLYRDPTGLLWDEFYVTWVPSSCGANVKVEISYDNGSTWNIVSHGGSTQIQDGWARMYEPYAYSENAKVRVTCNSNSSLTDVSNGSFKVLTGETPVSNDAPCSATSLEVNGNCDYLTFTNIGSSPSSIPLPADYGGNYYSDVWFKTIVPASGKIDINLKSDVTKGIVAAYSGTCSGLSLITYDQNNISISGRTQGEIIYIRHWNIVNYQSFDICITNPDAICGLAITSTNNINPTCDNNNGSINNIVLTGANGSVSYEWTNSAGTVIGSNNTISNLSAGIYELKVTDISGCVAKETITLQGTDTPEIISFNIQDATCGQNNGSASVTSIAGGVGTKTYEWKNGNNVVIGTGSSISNLGDGNYSLVVKDANNCTDTKTFSIANGVGPVINDYTVIATTCGANNGLINQLVVDGGIGNLSYVWKNSAGAIIETTSSLANVGAGNYTLIVSDENNCTNTTIITIPNLGGPTINITSQSIKRESCNQGDGAVEGLTISGGVGTLSYKWKNSANIVVANDLNPSNLSSGTYTLTVFDSENCLDQLTISIPTVNGPNLNSNNVQISNASCGDNNGAISGITVSGGVGNLSYQWINAVDEVVGTTVNLTGIAGGTYSLIVKDENGCSDNYSITVANNGNPTIVVTNIAISDANCDADNGSINGLSVANGEAPFTYKWTNTQGTIVATSLNLTNQASGDYQLEVADANNCTALININIEDTPLPEVINYDVVPANCGSNGVINNVLVIGGRGSITYEWQDGANTTIGNTSSVSGLAAGTYTLVVTDEDNCSQSIEINLPEGDAPTILAYEVTDASCNSLDGGITSLYVNGGSTPYSYQWKDESNNTVGSATSLINVASGTYTLEVTDANDCLASIDILVGEPASFAYYPDADNDGFGDDSQPQTGCTLPTGFVLNNLDCDDSNANIRPGALELCDGVDNNCNSLGDEPWYIYYLDSDGDGFGDANQSTFACSRPDGYSANDDDCDDTDETVYPNAIEICDGKDNDCDDEIDEDLIPPPIYDLAVVNISNNGADIIWGKIDGASEYEIGITPTSNNNLSYYSTMDTTYTLSNLLPSTEYRVFVRSKGCLIYGPWSPYSTFTTTASITSLTASVTQIQAGESIQFTYNTGTSGTTKELNYGDGTVETLTTNTGTLTHTYQYEGVYQASLRVDGVTVEYIRILVESCGWIGYVHSNNNYRENNEEACDFIASDKAYLPPSLSSTSYYWTNYALYKNIGISGDDMTLEMRSKNPSAEGGISCYDTRIYIYGTNSTAHVSYMRTGCDYYASIGAGGISHRGSEDDMTALGQDLSAWHNFKLQVTNGEVKTFYDGVEKYSLPFTEEVGDIIGIRLIFKGSGSVDWAKLSQGTNVIVDEQFSDCQNTCSINGDGCAEAITIPLYNDNQNCSYTPGTTIEATNSNVSSNCANSAWTDDDVWYTFTTPSTGAPSGITAHVDFANNNGSGIAIYDACTGNELACNQTLSVDNLSLDNALPANTTYYIRVWSYGGEVVHQSTFDICVYQNQSTNACDGVDLTMNNGRINNDTYKASETIESNGYCEAGDNIIFVAGKSITLKPGFEAKANSTFHAYITDCSAALVAPAENRSDSPDVEPDVTLNLQLKIQPNPSSSTTTLRYFLPESTQTALLIYNTNGQLIKHIIKQDNPIGWHEERLAVNDYPSGLYYVIIRTETDLISEKLAVSR